MLLKNSINSGVGFVQVTYSQRGRKIIIEIRVMSSLQPVRNKSIYFDRCIYRLLQYWLLQIFFFNISWFASIVLPYSGLYKYEMMKLVQTIITAGTDAAPFSLLGVKGHTISTSGTVLLLRCPVSPCEPPIPPPVQTAQLTAWRPRVCCRFYPRQLT